MGIVDCTNNKGTYHNYLRKAVPGLYTKGNGSMQEEQRNRYLDSIQMENAKKLGKARVAVFGRGCVGSYTAETLVKSGIGTVELIDRKQAENLLRAYPPPILEYDYIVDTMDVPEDKIALIILAGRYHIPVISCMDTGKCVNPSAFQAGDIFSIHQGASARGLSDMLYSHGIRRLRVVYSREEPGTSGDDGTYSDCSHCSCPPDRARKCTQRRRPSGCNAYVTAMAGMLLASEVVLSLAEGD